MGRRFVAQRQLLAKLIGRGSASILSQGLNTLCSLIATVAVARIVDAGAFGAWAIGYALCTATLVASRAVASTPILLSAREVEGASHDARGSVSLALLIGLASSALLLGGGVVSGSEVRSALFVFAAVVPVVTLQDATRYVFFRDGTPAKAAVIDASWLVVFVLGVSIGPTDSLAMETVTILWGGSAVLSAVAGMVMLRVRPSVRSGITFLVRNKWASSRLFVEAALTTLSTSLLPVLIAAIAGLSAAGAFRAGQTLLGVVALVLSGLQPIATVEVVKTARSRLTHFRFQAAWTAFVLLVTGLYGLCILHLPAGVGEALLGQTWSHAQGILIPLLVQAMLRGPITGVPISLRAAMALDLVVRLRIVVSTVTFASAVVGSVWGLDGIMWGLVVGTLISGAIALLFLLRIGSDGSPGGKAPNN